MSDCACNASKGQVCVYHACQSPIEDINSALARDQMKQTKGSSCPFLLLLMPLLLPFLVIRHAVMVRTRGGTEYTICARCQHWVRRQDVKSCGCDCHETYAAAVAEAAEEKGES